MSEAGSETLEDEWQSISEIASTCNTILESLSREGEATRALGMEARIGWGSFFLYHPAQTTPVSPQDSPSRRTEMPRELQRLMLSKPPCADLAPSLCACDHRLHPSSRAKHCPGQGSAFPDVEVCEHLSWPGSFKWAWEPARGAGLPVR